MKNIPCIYFLFNGDELVYIGKTFNLKHRIPNHFDKQYTYLRIIPCEKEKLYYYEMRLIKWFKPKYNRHGLIYKAAKMMQTFKLEDDLIEALKKLSVKENRSFNNYVETVLFNHVKKAR
jgi:excinuclease UvrABC nuclease subunit